jgi:hypothetical protein
MKKERSLKNVLNVKVKEECPRGRLRSRSGQQVRTDITQRKEGCGKKLRSSCVNTEMDGEADCWMTHLKWKCLTKKNKVLIAV